MHNKETQTTGLSHALADDVKALVNSITSLLQGGTNVGSSSSLQCQELEPLRAAIGELWRRKHSQETHVPTPDLIGGALEEELCDIQRLRVIREQCRSLFSSERESPAGLGVASLLSPRSVSGDSPWLERLERRQPERPLRSSRAPEFTVSGQSRSRTSAEGSRTLVKWLQRQVAVDSKENYVCFNK